jgi:hypothetical protein
VGRAGRLFKDIVIAPDGSQHRVDVFSCVGLIPLFACEVIDRRLLAGAPRFTRTMERFYRGYFDGYCVAECPIATNARGEHILSLVNTKMLRRILARLLNEHEFLSRYGVRSVSRIHAERTDLGVIPGVGRALIEYVPGESNSGMFGGNSNWRGPIWLPPNYFLVQAIEKYHRYLGDSFTVEAPCMNGKPMNLKEIATLIAERLVDIFRRDPQTGIIPAFPPDSPHQRDPHWKDLLAFNEYFHGETGLGLGAAHQTGWTGLIANLVFRRYRQDIPAFWRERSAVEEQAA